MRGGGRVTARPRATTRARPRRRPRPTATERVDGRRRATRTTEKPREVGRRRRRGGRSVGRRGGERIAARPRAATRTRPKRRPCHDGRRARGRTPTGAADDEDTPQGREASSAIRKERREALWLANRRLTARGAADATEAMPTSRRPPSAGTDADGRRGRQEGPAKSVAPSAREETRRETRRRTNRRPTLHSAAGRTTATEGTPSSRQTPSAGTDEGGCPGQRPSRLTSAGRPQVARGHRRERGAAPRQPRQQGGRGEGEAAAPTMRDVRRRVSRCPGNAEATGSPREAGRASRTRVSKVTYFFGALPKKKSKKI